MSKSNDSGSGSLISSFYRRIEQLTCESKRASCFGRIQDIEAALNVRSFDSDIASVLKRKLEQAKRFLKSNEFGACCYELQLLEKLFR